MSILHWVSLCVFFVSVQGYQINNAKGVAFVLGYAPLKGLLQPTRISSPCLQPPKGLQIRNVCKVCMTVGGSENKPLNGDKPEPGASTSSILGTRRDYLIATALALMASISLTFLQEFLSPSDREAPAEIQYFPKVDEDFLKKRGVRQWSIWESSSVPTTKFDYVYEKAESVYILEGEAVVTPKDGRRAVTLVPGVFASFPKGLSCTWDVKATVRKYYKEYEAIESFE